MRCDDRAVTCRFRSTPPREGRPASRRMPVDVIWRFDPRPRAGGDSDGGMHRAVCGCFDPRPRVGGDRGLRQCVASTVPFRSTPPREGRLAAQRTRRIAGFRSTPPREGRRAIWPRREDRRSVSIHAPARGATRT